MSKNQETTCEITIGGQTRVGMFPRLPVRYFLQASLRNALGMADGSEPDAFAIPMVYFAIVGVCWPTPIRPSFRECRHDTSEFGSVVYEHLADLYPDADLVSEVAEIAVPLLGAMLGSVKKLDEAVTAEAGFTKGRAPISITG
ncbi:MAG: hypothetical protein KAI41_07400 [Hyphomicrobiaceae bacterium]|nr:hypothetical protein [Hyphomicrobiaceae bacterium]